MNKSKILKRVFAGILIFTSCFVTLMHNTQTASASVRFSYQNLLNTRGKLKSNSNEGLSNGDILFDSEKRNACPVYKITYKLDNDSQFRDTCFTGASVEGEGGFEIMVRDDEDGQTHWYGSASYKNNEAISEEFSDSFHGIKLSKLNLIPHTDKFGSTVLEVKMTVTNTNSYSKKFSLATSGDIQIADDDNAAIQRIGNGFIMTNKWCDTSATYLGDVPVATLTVAAQNAPYVTDADTVFTGHYHDRGKSMWDNNTLGDSTTIKNQTKHGGATGANGMEDTGFAISWQGRTLAAGESQSFSYTIGIGEYKPTNYIEFDSMSDDLNWTNVTKQVTFSQTNNNTLTSTPTRTGYDFAGWWTTTDNSGAMVYDANGKCNNNCVYWKNGAWNGYQDITVYAHWTPKKYTITFNQTGATTKGTASTTVDFRGHTVNITPPKQIYKVNYHATSAKNSATFKTELQTNQFNGYVYTGYTISNKGGDAQEFTVSDVYNSNSGMVMHESSSQNNVHYFQFEIHDDFGDDDSYISLKLDKSYTGQLLATATGFDDGITLEVDSDGESIVELDNSNDKDWGYITDSNELRFYILGNSHSGNYITVKFVILSDVSMTKNTTIYDGTGKMQCNYNLNKNITLQPDWDTSDLKVLSEGYGGNPVVYWVDDDGVVYSPGEYNEFSKDTDLYPVYKESYTVRLHPGNIDDSEWTEMEKSAQSYGWTWNTSEKYFSATFYKGVANYLPDVHRFYSTDNYRATGSKVTSKYFIQDANDSYLNNWWTSPTDGNDVGRGQKTYNNLYKIASANNNVVDLYPHWVGRTSTYEYTTNVSDSSNIKGYSVTINNDINSGTDNYFYQVYDDCFFYKGTDGQYHDYTGTNPELKVTASTDKVGYKFAGWHHSMWKQGWSYIENPYSTGYLTNGNGRIILKNSFNIGSSSQALYTLLAGFRGIEYTVRLNANVPDNASSTLQVLHDNGTGGYTYNKTDKYFTRTLTYDASQDMLSPNVYSLTGYHLVSDCAWYMLADGGESIPVKYIADPSTKFPDWTEDKWNLTTTDGATVDLYARWTANKYNITYNLAGGTFGTSHPASVNYDETFTVDNPDKSGYVFSGWKITGNDSGTSVISGNTYKNLTPIDGATVTFTATWSKEAPKNAKYTIKHYKMDVNGNYPDSPDDTETFTGLIGSSVIPAVKDYGEGFEKPAEQTVTIKADGSTVVEYKYARKQYYLNLNGYLKQWESQSNKGYLSELVETVKNLKGTDSRYTFATAVIKINGTVHAKGNGVTDFYEKVYYGSTYEVVTTAKAGYTIIDNTGKLTGTVDKANDTDNTVTPRLSINSYIIKFNANKPAKATGSVTGTTSDQSIYYNRERKLNKNGYALNGWQFNGWNTQPDGTGVTYNDEQSVKNLSAKDGDNINLYAQWTPSGYTVATTKTTGISSTSGDGTYHDGDKVLINAVVQAGYNFDGWYLDNSKVTDDTSYSFTMTPGNKTFTAKATAKQFNITLIARYEQPDGSFKEETVIDNKLYDFGSTVSWSRAEDKEYREASISWIVTGNDIKYVDVKRRTYNQTLTVQYENADGSFTNPETVINAEPYRYGSIVSWSRAQDAVYQKAEISWTVTGDAKENVKVYRNKYTITVNGDSHIESTSGSGTYRYGTKITISATPKYGYRFVNWNNDSGLTVNPMSGTVTHDAAYTAYTTANNYTLTYNKGATNVAANNFTETYPYGKSVNIAVNKFTGRSYNISFDSNGGSSVAAIKGSLEFYKWIDSNKTSWQPSQNYTVERDMTFTAQWKNKTITFSTPSREGYTFTGWYDGNNKIDSLTITPADTAYTKQLTAHWQINQYPVIVEHYIMDTNGNYSSKPDKTVKGVNGQPVYNYHTDILSTACIDKSLIIAGGIEYDSDKTPEKTTVTADSNGTVIRIYYKRIKHTVTFNVAENGGYWEDNTSNTNRTISVYYGNAYSSSSFDNIAVKGFNFDFKGWNTQYDTVDSMKSLNAKMGTGDITYYAIYSKDITTTFIDCQGARTVNVTIWNKDRQGIISVPAIRDYNWKDTTGCKPIGYNSTSDINKDGAISAQVADNSSLTVSDNATYYAVYTAKATLVYDTKEGTLKNSDSKITVDVFCNANDINNVRGTQIKLAYCDRNPISQDGYNHTYDFANWESSLDGKTYDAGKTFTVTKNMIMTAVWNETITPITYTIHFEKVLGEAVTNVPDDITAVYDKAVTIPDNVPVRTGFTFTGWALIENATTDIISPGSTVKNLTTTDGAVVNLYAQWKQRKLVIVKASSTMYNDTIIRRTAGDDEWYNSVGKLGIQDLKNYPDDKCVQVWKIDKNGNITQTK